jgi:hypothetical protein
MTRIYLMWNTRTILTVGSFGFFVICGLLLHTVRLKLYQINLSVRNYSSKMSLKLIELTKQRSTALSLPAAKHILFQMQLLLEDLVEGYLEFLSVVVSVSYFQWLWNLEWINPLYSQKQSSLSDHLSYRFSGQLPKELVAPHKCPKMRKLLENRTFAGSF